MRDLLLFHFSCFFIVFPVVLFDLSQLSCVRFGMHASVEFGMSEELLIALHKLPSSFLIQTALRERHYQ